MTRDEYRRVANRGMAVAQLTVVATSLEQFRFHGELSGLNVNPLVVEIKERIDILKDECNKASLADWPKS